MVIDFFIKFGKIFNMKAFNRRRFLETLGITVPFAATLKSGRIFDQNKEMFIHHVYFWLKRPGNAEDRGKLVEALKKLAKVKTIQQYHISLPAGTSRDVIDSSYDISWLTFFNSAADQDSYQVDPIHKKFVEENSDLWQKVVVYDSIDI
jgi:hypothetical protein